MRTEIHPEVHETTVVCSGCQAEFKTHSTVENIRIEICSNCHPFYTGKQSRIIDTEGRVEKFVKKFQGLETRVSKRQRREEQAAIKATRDAEEAKQQAAAPVAEAPPVPESESPEPEASSESTEQS